MRCTAYFSIGLIVLLATFPSLAQQNHQPIEKNIYREYKANPVWRSNTQLLNELFGFLKDHPEHRDELNFENVSNTQWKYIGAFKEIPDKPSGSPDHLKIYLETSVVFAQYLTFEPSASNNIDLYLHNDWCPHHIKIENINFTPIEWIHYREELDNIFFGLLGNNDGLDAIYSTISGTSSFVDSSELLKNNIEKENQNNELSYRSTFLIHGKENNFYYVEPKIGACFLAMDDTFLVCNTSIHIPQGNRYSSNPIQVRSNGYRYNPQNPLDGYYIFEYKVYEKIPQSTDIIVVENN